MLMYEFKIKPTTILLKYDRDPKLLARIIQPGLVI